MLVKVEPQIHVQIRYSNHKPSPFCTALIRRVFGVLTKTDYSAEDGTFLELWHTDETGKTVCVGACGFYLNKHTGRYLLHTDCVSSEFRGKKLGQLLYLLRIEYLNRQAPGKAPIPIDIHVEHKSDGYWLLMSVLRSDLYNLEHTNNLYDGFRHLMVFTLRPDKTPITKTVTNIKVPVQYDIWAPYLIQ